MKLHAPKVFNKANLVGVFESGTSEWHEARQDGLGGSEVGVAMGLSQWESPMALWAKKTGKIPTEPLNNWAVRFGQAFEGPILGLLQEEHPDWEIFSTGTYSHSERPWMHANPDALAKVDGEWVIVEVKTSRNYWDEIPPTYIAQVRHYMYVMGIKRAVIVGVVNMAWVEHWIEWDEFEEQVLLQTAQQFWSCIVNDEAPAWDGSTSTYETVRAMHPDITDEEVEIDGGHTLPLLQMKYEEVERELLKAKSEMLGLMGNAKHAFVEHEGTRYRVASRQARGMGRPYLVIHKGK